MTLAVTPSLTRTLGSESGAEEGFQAPSRDIEQPGGVHATC